MSNYIVKLRILGEYEKTTAHLVDAPDPAQAYIAAMAEECNEAPIFSGCGYEECRDGTTGMAYRVESCKPITARQASIYRECVK